MPAPPSNNFKITPRVYVSVPYQQKETTIALLLISLLSKTADKAETQLRRLATKYASNIDGAAGVVQLRAERTARGHRSPRHDGTGGKVARSDPRRDNRPYLSATVETARVPYSAYLPNVRAKLDNFAIHRRPARPAKETGGKRTGRFRK